MKIGLVVNPVAGIGGPAGLKGSDGVTKLALELGSRSQVSSRVKVALNELLPLPRDVTVFTCPHEMGGNVCKELGIPHTIIGSIGSPTSAVDTKMAIRRFSGLGIDLVLFAGGDGTARDICDIVPKDQIVLGIPCGVKMHSAVFANNPRAAGQLVKSLTSGMLFSVMDAEVRDIDEQELRLGKVNARNYGRLCIPAQLNYMQATKTGGREVEEIVKQEIAAEVSDNMAPETIYVIGAGTTTAALMDNMRIDNTLLGVDVVRDKCLLASDVTENELYTIVNTKLDVKIVISCIGGQGHIFGRGNQQLSPRVIRSIGIENIIIIATKTKLKQLNGRPMLIDTGDVELDIELCGLRRVITGYEESALLRVSN